MRKHKLGLVFLTFLLVAVFLQGEISHAQENNDNFTLQHLVTNSAANYIFFTQGVSGIIVPNFSDGGQVSVNFDNVKVTGVYNATYGIGAFRNQGSLSFVNIQPDQDLPPALFLGQTFLENNKVNIKDYNYSVNLNFNGFRASGIVVLNLMAASFSNQFTSVHLTMGKNNTSQPPIPKLNVIQDNNSTLVELSRGQMRAVAATANNDVQVQGKQSAVTTVEGTPDVQGICAITLSSGFNNHVVHRVGINIDMKAQ